MVLIIRFIHLKIVGPSTLTYTAGLPRVLGITSNMFKNRIDRKDQVDSYIWILSRSTASLSAAI